MRNNAFKALFLYSTYQASNDAYTYRLDKFKNYFEDKGCFVKSVYLKDFADVPGLFQPVNIYTLVKMSQDIDFIHAGGTPCAYFMKLGNRLIGKKFVYDVHGDVFQESLLNNDHKVINYFDLFQKYVMEKFAERSLYIITCSEPLKIKYITQGVDPENIEIIRNGVDLKVFRPKKNNNFDENRKFIVTYAGGFQRWQGIDNLLYAINMIESTEILFQIIGFTEEDRFLKEKIYNKYGNRVRLIDSLQRNKLIDYFNNSDILIIPRKSHPAISVAFPTKFAEYIAIGKPVIVTRVDETASFVEKYKCGFVCEPNPLSIANTIMFAKDTSSEELRQMGNNARRLSEKEFDQNIINKKYCNFISKITNC